ncbi:hypothetical protein F5888DRAFT_1888530 [Russula emetica]|nr:hypothetical protein F5888DRAFT_1888530 [Russula emetica]
MTEGTRGEGRKGPGHSSGALTGFEGVDGKVLILKILGNIQIQRQSHSSPYGDFPKTSFSRDINLGQIRVQLKGRQAPIIHDEIGEQNIRGGMWCGICVTDHPRPIRSVQAGGADHPNCERVGENKGVGHVWGYMRENCCWWIGSSKERAVPTWTRFLDENVPGYDWSGGRRECFSNEEKGNSLCDRIAECGAGGNGGGRGSGNVDDMGSEIPSVARGPHTAHSAKAALINDSSSPTTVPT